VKLIARNHHFCKNGHGKRAAGFTLVEFLIAMAMFLVLGAAVLSLFASHAPYFNRQQNLVAVNISMQNAVSQM
jgi:prepilin-type N-terminal cleavage/methylation domain-containing protein